MTRLCLPKSFICSLNERLERTSPNEIKVLDIFLLSFHDYSMNVKEEEKRCLSIKITESIFCFTRV